MIVVSDTGPLNYLTIIGYVHILHSLYGEVVIPQAVEAELSRETAPIAARDLILSKPHWLRIVCATACDPDLSAMGDGEQQAITLAVTLHADLLLCDDLAARKAAEQKSVRVVGTLGVLKESGDQGLINFQDALTKLRATNFRISNALVDQISSGPDSA